MLKTRLPRILISMGVLKSFSLYSLVLCSIACSSAPTSTPPFLTLEQLSPTPKKETPVEFLQFEKKLNHLEIQLAQANDQLIKMQHQIESLSHRELKKTKPIPKQKISPQTTEDWNQILEQLPTPKNSNHLSHGFVHDESVHLFRQSMIFFQTKKFSEAILSFSKFLGKFADHPLASSAQFYVGLCYFEQGEFPLSLQEFQRILTDYEHGIHITDTLQMMILVEKKLKRHEDALFHQQLLSSLFPQSPAASLLTYESL